MMQCLLILSLQLLQTVSLVQRKSILLSHHRSIFPLQSQSRLINHNKYRRSSSSSRYTITRMYDSKQTNFDEANKLENQENNHFSDEKNDLFKSYLILGILLLAFTSNQMSRQAIFYLCNFSPEADSFYHMNAALSFTQQQYATAASVGFTFFFALSSFIAGSITDTFPRNRILALSCLLWSFVTICESSSTSFTDLLLLRVLLAIFQSFFNPAAYTLISDVFPKQFIGTANGILGGGIYLGGGLASLSILLNQNIGWRSTLSVIGFAGLAIATIMWLIIPDQNNSLNNTVLKQDKQLLSSSEPQLQEYINSIKDVFKSSGARTLLLASALRFAAGFTIGIWKAPFIFAKFPGQESLFAGGNAFIVAGGGLASSLIGGFLSDTLAQKYKNDSRVRIWVPAIGSLLAAPLWLGFIQANDPSTAAAILLAEYLAAECWVGPTLAGLYSAVPENRRGTAQGVFSFLTAVGNLAPLLVGLLVEGNVGLQLSIGDSLMLIVGVSYFVAGALFLSFALNSKNLALEISELDKIT